jgi:hypothetical protein
VEVDAVAVGAPLDYERPRQADPGVPADGNETHICVTGVRLMRAPLVPTGGATSGPHDWTLGASWPDDELMREPAS